MPDPDQQRPKEIRMATTEDHRGICVACGHPATPRDQLVVVDGHHIHTSHTQNPRSGYYQKH